MYVEPITYPPQALSSFLNSVTTVKSFQVYFCPHQSLWRNWKDRSFMWAAGLTGFGLADTVDKQLFSLQCQHPEQTKPPKPRKVHHIYEFSNKCHTSHSIFDQRGLQEGGRAYHSLWQHHIHFGIDRVSMYLYKSVFFGIFCKYTTVTEYDSN